MCVLTSEESKPGNGDQELRAELSRTERDLSSRIDPGRRALVIGVITLVLVLSSVLPWIGVASGWQVLTGQTDPALHVTLLPRLFAINSTIAGVLLSALALTTRRWAMAWVAAMACTVVTFEGLIAIWSRQTVPQAGPSIGLVLAVLCMIVLAIQWLRIVWSRP